MHNVKTRFFYRCPFFPLQFCLVTQQNNLTRDFKFYWELEKAGTALLHFWEYRISSFSFHRSYSFLNLEIIANSNSCRNISIFYLINWIFAARTIQRRKLFKGRNYMRKYGMYSYTCALRKHFSTAGFLPHLLIQLKKALILAFKSQKLTTNIKMEHPCIFIKLKLKSNNL